MERSSEMTDDGHTVRTRTPGWARPAVAVAGALLLVVVGIVVGRLGGDGSDVASLEAAGAVAAAGSTAGGSSLELSPAVGGAASATTTTAGAPSTSEGTETAGVGADPGGGATRTPAPSTPTRPTVPTTTTTTSTTEPEPEPVVLGEHAGLSASDARTRLAAAGLDVAVEDVAVTDASADGLVVEQSPSAGTELLRGSTVVLRVGRYQAAVVPDVTGLGVGDASSRLGEAQRAAGFEPGGYFDDIVCSDGGGGRVIAQDPAAGTPITAGFTATLTFGAGCAPVPNVVGLTLADAVGTLNGWSQDGRNYAWTGPGCPSPSSAEAASVVITSTSPAVGSVVAFFSVRCAPAAE